MFATKSCLLTRLCEATTTNKVIVHSAQPANKEENRTHGGLATFPAKCLGKQCVLIQLLVAKLIQPGPSDIPQPS